MATYTKTNWQNGITPINDTNLNKIENALEQVFNMIYPVGSIYMSVNSTSPSTLFGGTWEQLQGRFLIGVGSATDTRSDTRTLTNGQTGGEWSHTLTINEIPSHTHTFKDGGKLIVASGTAYGVPDYVVKQGQTLTTDATGGGQAHNNIPPYLAVYMWKRTA